MIFFQIPEHCPWYRPGCIDMRVVWFKCCGRASLFRPNGGLAHECRTSSEEVNIWIVTSVGGTPRLSPSSNHSSPGFRSDVEITEGSEIGGQLCWVLQLSAGLISFCSLQLQQV